MVTTKRLALALVVGLALVACSKDGATPSRASCPGGGDSESSFSGTPEPAGDPGTGSGPGWSSVLYPLDAGGGGHTTQSFSAGGREFRLLDYSYSGYTLGQKSLASNLPCDNVRISGNGDITAELQSAVDSLGKAQGGSVLIPAGHFTLTRSISIPYDNVSIVGASSELTVIEVPASYNPKSDCDEGIFTFGKLTGGWNKAWVDRGSVITALAQIAREGDSQIAVADATAIAPGDWIVITQYHWPDFSRRNSGGVWPSYNGFPANPASADREFTFSYLRQVLDRSGNLLSLDAPLPWTLDPANNPVQLRRPDNSITNLRHNVGVAGLSIEFAGNANAENGRPAGSGVYFEGVRDGWIYDVKVSNFPRYGFYMDHAARITILDSAVNKAQDYGEGGYGYGVNIRSSQNILVRRTQVHDTRHGFSSRGALSSMLVYSQSESSLSTLNDDTHFAMSQGLLWDAHRLVQTSGLMGIYRGAESSGAHETVGSVAYWNVSGDGTRDTWYGGAMTLNPSSDGWAIVVGTTGIRVNEAAQPLSGSEAIPESPGVRQSVAKDTPGPGSRDANAFYEGVGQSGLTPASLYTDLLGNRFATPPADFSAACPPPP